LHFTYNIILPNGRFITHVNTRYKDTCFIIILNADSVQQRNELLLKMDDIVNNISFMDRQ
jgi:hypothetical protein